MEVSRQDLGSVCAEFLTRISPDQPIPDFGSTESEHAQLCAAVTARILEPAQKLLLECGDDVKQPIQTLVQEVKQGLEVVNGKVENLKKRVSDMVAELPHAREAALKRLGEHQSTIFTWVEEHNSDTTNNEHTLEEETEKLEALLRKITLGPFSEIKAMCEQHSESAVREEAYAIWSNLTEWETRTRQALENESRDGRDLRFG